MIQISCPACGTPLQFHESVVGTKRQCPKCKASFVVPAMRMPHQRDRKAADRPDEGR